ncbi:DUF411 domain-containing protein [Paracoccus sp. (in: a-proteobacteria)]|uniref:DUF411 domain-containing protein n=1 Tax=Paracoccus sp. TaxID=267 RepID=UPI00185ECED1|nr:metal-binding protein [Paracoccus sp. (in: a-proteobacteria)]
MKNVFAFAPIAALAVAGGIAFALPSFAQETGSAASAGAPAEAAAQSKQLTMWRSPGCGCCDAWGAYMEKAGYTVEIIDDRNFDKTSVSVGVPQQGLGCHLAKVGGYFIGGLVPAEVVDRLLEEKPEITGITLPGMPPNAPGMAKQKSGTLRVYSFGPEGVAVYSDE